MKKATIEFNCEHKLRMVLDAHKFYLCLFDIEQEAKRMLKHGHQFNSASEVLEWVRKEINEEVNLYGYE